MINDRHMIYHHRLNPYLPPSWAVWNKPISWLMISWGIILPPWYWGLFHNPIVWDPDFNQPRFKGTRFPDLVSTAQLFLFFERILLQIMHIHIYIYMCIYIYTYLVTTNIANWNITNLDREIIYKWYIHIYIYIYVYI